MDWLMRVIFSSVGKKIIMALTGLFLCSFLTVHLMGNLQLFKHDGGAAFEAYSKFMSTNGLIRFLEIGMALGFFLHIFDGVYLWYKNRQARPIGYKKNEAAENSSFFSRTMIWSGSIIFVFLIIHLNNFFIEHRIFDPGAKTMYDSVMGDFHEPTVVWFYVFAMILLAFHLNHGFQSAFQTLGINHKKYTPVINFLGLAFSILIPLMYAVIPFYFCYFIPKPL